MWCEMREKQVKHSNNNSNINNKEQWKVEIGKDNNNEYKKKQMGKFWMKSIKKMLKFIQNTPCLCMSVPAYARFSMSPHAPPHQPPLHASSTTTSSNNTMQA